MNLHSSCNPSLLITATIAASLLGGCITDAPPAPKNWTIVWTGDSAPAVAPDKDAYPVRLTQVDVRAPYNTTKIPVLRADGSIAFDGFNAFASSPSSLLRGPTADALERTGRFSAVIPFVSSVATPLSIEASVELIALDCTKPGQRNATVELLLVLMQDRAIVRTARGSAAVPVDDGNFSVAFSKAYTQAVTAAATKLVEKK